MAFFQRRVAELWERALGVERGMSRLEEAERARGANTDWAALARGGVTREPQDAEERSECAAKDFAPIASRERETSWPEIQARHRVSLILRRTGQAQLRQGRDGTGRSKGGTSWLDGGQWLCPFGCASEELCPHHCDTD